MKTTKIYLLLCHDKYEIKFICNDKHYLYLYINNIIYTIQYFQKEFKIIKSVKMDDRLFAINCLCYLQINSNNILIKCEENKDRICRIDYIFCKIRKIFYLIIEKLLKKLEINISNKSNQKIYFFKREKN